MAERKVAWAPYGTNTLIGAEVLRTDGPVKASGHAKYSNDINTPGTLFAKLLTSPHGKAKVAKLDVEPAKKMPGVKAVHIFRDLGSDLTCEGELIVAVAAERPEQAIDGVKAIIVAYEVLDHFVDEDDLATAEARGLTKSQGENKKGDVDAALAEAKAVHKGY
ncbi:MAG: hypothetical protein B7Z55_09635, partial [Planctomycetales bacterium 12-60-4]